MLGYVLVHLLMMHIVKAVNYCEDGKCGLCENAANGVDQTCRSCYYSLPLKIADDVFKCTGN